MVDKQLLVCQNDTCTHKIRLWPRPVAEQRLNRDSEWERFYPEFRIVSYPLPSPKVKKKDRDQLELALDVASLPKKTSHSKRQIYDQLRQTLPPSYGIALAPFKSHQWNMISYLSKHRRFYELLKTNAVLAFILANNREINWGVCLNEISLDELTGMK